MEESGVNPVEESSSKEVTKRWSFRRSTIARREFMEEIGNLDISTVSAPRRVSRQGRGKGKVQDKGKETSGTALTSPAPKRGVRRSAPANLSSVPSPVMMDEDIDGQTNLELGGGGGDCFADLDANPEKSQNSNANPHSSVAPETALDIAAALSDRAEDSDDLTLLELQERARSRQKPKETKSLCFTDLHLNTNTVNNDLAKAHEPKSCIQTENSYLPGDASSPCSAGKVSRHSATLKTGQTPLSGCRKNEDEEGQREEDAFRALHDTSSEDNDPNALYCICRQKHNNRFMICCDRCQEWFHGDCVGISEARGRLLEENEEDYICPSCSPCQSPVDVLKQPVFSRAALSSSSESLFSTSAGEDRTSEDECIRGKIRKATTSSSKKRFRIFKSVEVVAAVMEPEKEEKKVKKEKTEEKAAIPKCIGPGCFNDALPESVYCGHQCIIKHAAVAMQNITEPKTQPQPQIQTKPAPKPVPKIQKKIFLEKLFKRKPVEKVVKEEDGGSKSGVKVEIEKHVSALQPSDSEPKAAGLKESEAISPSVFYKSTAVKEEMLAVESKAEIKHDSPQSQTLNSPASSEPPEKMDQSTEENVDVKENKLVDEKEDKKTEGKEEEKLDEIEERKTADREEAKPDRRMYENVQEKEDKKTDEKVEEKAACSVPLLKKTITPSRAKKTMPGSPRLAGLKQLQTTNKSLLTEPEKPAQSQEAVNTPEVLKTTAGPEIRVLPVTPAPVPPPRSLQTHPNMQMRQNIRRSLAETLLKRATESDDPEMFNMYYTTDNKYKTKYRTLLMSLKDPKNKGLFSQVIRGQITPFKLTRLSQQELQCAQERAAASLPLKEEKPSIGINMEELISLCEEKVLNPERISTSSEEKASVSQVKAASPRKVSAVSDIISSMLNDTTPQHRAHLFDLKCRICTGQISADEDPESKKVKKEELTVEEEEKVPCVIQMYDKKAPDPAPVEADPIMESPASPTAEDLSVEMQTADFSPLVIPEISVSITRRDPRTAAYRHAPSTSAPPAAPPVAPPSAPAAPPAQHQPRVSTEKEMAAETKIFQPLPLPPPPPMPKSILMKPSATAVSRFYTSSSTTRLASSHTQRENETNQFLSNQDTVWKGFLNMQNVAKFVTKAYLISGSGSAETLKKDLPDTIHIVGRISPQTVWEYVEKVKTSVTKELSLIRFHPATDEEEVAYVSLFSYFNSRRRFGVVSNICNNVKDLYLIPLGAKESIPSVLPPLEGPGLEEQHPNLLIGLAVCQKLKRLGTPVQETDEKRPRIGTPLDLQGDAVSIKPAVPDIKPDESEPYDPYIPISITPPGSPPATRSPESSSSSSNLVSDPSLLSSLISVVNLPEISKTTSSSLPPPPVTSTSSGATPLETILNTLFGKKTQDMVNTPEPNSSAVKESPVSTALDPIVQQYQQTPRNTTIEKMELEDNDRPYDPEEEYDPCTAYKGSSETSQSYTFTPTALEGDDDDRPYDPEEEYSLGNKVDAVTLVLTKPPEAEQSVHTSSINNDIEYDPEDETLFEEMQTYLADKNLSAPQYATISTAGSLSEQQKMLEELNRQIEEQKRQLEEQEEALRLQRAAVGVSMAHFSVSDALMSPPPRFGREPEEATEKPLVVPIINLSRDPRQCRNVRQEVVTVFQNDKDNSLNENRRLVTQASFLVPSNSSMGQDKSKTVPELMKKDTDMSSVAADDVNTGSTSIDSAMTLKDYTLLSASEPEEGAYSSSGNENSQRSHSHLRVSGKSKESHTSKRDNRSSTTRRSRHERRSSREERSSRVSREEADMSHKRGRHSSERSPRRSRSRSRRAERVSSRHKDRHRRRSISRHRRRDQHSTRSRSSRNEKSAQSDKDKTHQTEESALVQGTESAQQTQNINQDTSGTNNIQVDKSQNETQWESVSEIPKVGFARNKYDKPQRHLPAANSSQKDNILQSNSEQLYHEKNPPQGPLSVQRDSTDKDSKTRFQNRDEPEVLSDNSVQREPSNVLPQIDRNISSKRQGDLHPQLKPDLGRDSKPHTYGENSLQRNDFPRNQRSNVERDESVFSSQRDEQSFRPLELKRSHSSGPEGNHRRQQPSLQVQRESFSETDEKFSRNKSSKMHQHKDLPSMQKPNFAQDAVKLLQGKHPQRPARMQRTDFEKDKADDNVLKRKMHEDETEELNQHAERYLGNLSVEESGHHRSLHLQRNEPTQRDLPKISPLNQRGFSMDEINLSQIHDRPPEEAHSVMRPNQLQGDHDIPSNLYPREQFRPRTPGDQWTLPQLRNIGPRGPPSLLTPRCPTATMRPRMPRGPHPERFENCQSGQNCRPGPRDRFPRPRIIDKDGPSPNFGPRGPSSGPGFIESSKSQNFAPRGPNPESSMFDEVSPQNSGFRGRFQGPGNGPQNFRPRGLFAALGRFKSPGHGPCNFQCITDGPNGPCQLRHEGPGGPSNVRGPPQQEFETRDSSHTRREGGPECFNSDHFISQPGDKGHADKRYFDSRDSKPRDFHGSRDGSPTRPFDEIEVGNREFLLQRANDTRRPVPPQHPDEQSIRCQNSADETYPHPKGPRVCMQGQGPPHSRPEDVQIPERESSMRRLQQLHKCKEPEMQEQTSGAHLCKGGRDFESIAHMKGPRFNPPQNLRGQRTSSNQFPRQRMFAPLNKVLLHDKPYSAGFTDNPAPKLTRSQRPQGPKPGLIQNQQPQMVQPKIQLDGPPKEPDIRPLRLSGPLLPTPPGGPLMLHKPRMQRPYSDIIRPQGPPPRSHNAGMNPCRLDDNSNHPQRERCQSLIQERPREVLVSRDEESSSQESSPVKAGKPWRRRQRKREGRKRATKRRRFRDRRQGAGETARDRNTDADQKT
ncbi:death-inducer obliterator 1 isoform X2 [Hoplias malabaricus]|uniref:death-inducer obliterator 1 isoform X2 n=1 Tax=Hoplias malabaricus TaxID=27720 RepID=UPI003462A0B8